MESRVVLISSFNTGQIDPRIFSGFLEHLGRSIYEGVYDPESELSNEDGIRTEVAETMTGMNMPYVRYPGGTLYRTTTGATAWGLTVSRSLISPGRRPIQIHLEPMNS